MNGNKNRAAALGLMLFAMGALVGAVASNKEIRQQLREKIKTKA